MVGRKAPRNGKAKVVVSKDLKAKTAKKLKKLRPDNLVDLQRITSFQKLNIATHKTKNATLTEELHNDIDLFLPDLNRTWASLLAQLKEGLPVKRLSALSSLSVALKSTPAALGVNGIALIQQLTPRLIDDDDQVRSYAISLVADGVFGTLRTHGKSDALLHFCKSISGCLWSQLVNSLRQMIVPKKLDGIRYLRACLHQGPQKLFWERAFISTIVPQLMNSLSVGLRPGKVRNDRKKSGSALPPLTPFDNALQPCSSRWGPLIMLSLLSCLIHICSPQINTQEASCGVDYKSLHDILSRCLCVDRSVEEEAPRKGNEFGDLTSVPLVFSIVEYAYGFLRLALTQVEDPTLRREAITKLGGVALLTISILRYVVGLQMLEDNMNSTNLDQIKSPIARHEGSQELVKILFRGDGSHLIRHGKNGSVILKCLSDILTASDLLDSPRQAELVRQECHVLIWSLLLCNCRSDRKGLGKFVKQAITLGKRYKFQCDDVADLTILPDPTYLALRTIRQVFGTAAVPMDFCDIDHSTKTHCDWSSAVCKNRHILAQQEPTLLLAAVSDDDDVRFVISRSDESTDDSEIECSSATDDDDFKVKRVYFTN